MAKFKVGDKVVCVNSGESFTTYPVFAEKHGLHNYLSRADCKEGKEYTIVCVGQHEWVAEYGDILGVQDDQGRQFIIEETGVEIVKSKQPNGVDAQGNPSHFDQTMLKPFMRVVTKNQGTWVCVTTSEDTTPILGKVGQSTFINSLFIDNDVCGIDEEYSAQEIYKVRYPADRLASVEDAELDLLWKRTPPKTAEQLAQEAAVAARKAAIEEAEKALKTAQERLEALKGM